MATTAEVFAAMNEAVRDGGKSLHRKFKGDVLFTVGGESYSLNLSSPNDCKVTKGDVFDGKADLTVNCSEEVMGKMIRKEVQPQQGM